MSPVKEVRYTSRSITPPPKRQSRSLSPPTSRERSRSRSQDYVDVTNPGNNLYIKYDRSQDYVDVTNPGNNLYIKGLSVRVTSSDLEKYFSKEGKVLECQVVIDPRTRESRGFAFVTMETVEHADRCIKYLDRSVLEGRLITVEKAKRNRGRAPTPGSHLGAGDRRESGHRRSHSRSPYGSQKRDGSLSRSQRERSRSPYARDSHTRRRERSISPAGDDYDR